ncbi:MAG: hypothetical protein LC659_15280, partial [Myxococcales bacterium]|nr:hypothetical protein [Myxococcales bacterium]
AQDIPIRDTTLDVLSVTAGDTTFVDSVAVTVENALPRGVEPFLLLASRGDTLDTRAITRFDSLPATYNKSATDTAAPIIEISSAVLKLRIEPTGTRATQPVTLSVYDVDSAGSDSVGALFRADRLLGSATFAVADLKDTIGIPLSNDSILAKMKAGGRVRFGIQATSAASVQLRLYATTNTTSTVGPALSVQVADTAIKTPFLFGVRSLEPRGDRKRAFELADYTYVVHAPEAPGPMTLAVGGLPARRTYIRFALPPLLVDSSTIVRATLLLTQIPTPTVDLTDSISVFPLIGLAASAITEPARAATLATRTVFFPTDSVSVPTLRLVPASSGQRQIEIGDLVRRWRLHPAKEPRAIVLQAEFEGSTAAEARFYSNDAPEALRPKLRLRYISRVQFGLP